MLSNWQTSSNPERRVQPKMTAVLGQNGQAGAAEGEAGSSYPAFERSEQRQQATELAQERDILLEGARLLVIRCQEAVPPAERELAVMLHQLRLARLGSTEEHEAVFTAYQQLYPSGWLRYLVEDGVEEWLVKRGEFTAFTARSLLAELRRQWPQARVLAGQQYEQRVGAVLHELATADKVRQVRAGGGFAAMYTTG